MGLRAPATSTDAPTTSTTPDERPSLFGWSYLCEDDSPDVTTYQANVDVPAAEIRVLVAETAGSSPIWVEEHGLDGGPTAFALELETAEEGEVKDGARTLFDCARVDGLTVVWRIYDVAGLADCVVVGQDPEAVLDGLPAYDWSLDAAPTALGEINGGNCRFSEGTATTQP